jgi:hypothetical protein
MKYVQIVRLRHFIRQVHVELGRLQRQPEGSEAGPTD